MRFQTLKNNESKVIRFLTSEFNKQWDEKPIVDLFLKSIRHTGKLFTNYNLKWSFLFIIFFILIEDNLLGQTAVNCPTSGYTTVNAYSTNYILYDNGGTGNYTNNCNGYIFIRGGGSKIITISGTYTTEANYDYIYIYEGEGLGSGTAISTLTGGNNTSYSFTGTAGKSYTIRFYSDISTVKSGFVFNVTTTGTAGTLTTVPNGSNNSVACGTNVMLQDPQGTSNYSNSQSGYTVLNATGCASISLIGSYWLEGSSYDLIKIYNGSGVSGTVLATYGASVNGLISYNGQPGQTLTVQFTSDGSGVNPGFYITANYSGICAPPGNPAVFGSNAWNVYCYGAGDASGGSNAWLASKYYGYYTMSTLNFDTRTGQTNSNTQSWGDGGSPSSASGYQGCSIGVDNHSYIFKRQGFTCGTYQLNLPSHDDMAILLVDGIEVWRNYGCCATRTAVWTGYLGSTSTVELRVSEGSGGSHGALEFVNLPISATVTGTNPTTCAGNGSITMSNVQNGHRSVYQSDFSSTPVGASLTGNASIAGGELTLTAATNSQLGSAVFTPSYRANAWTANYSQFIGGGNGADGMSFTYGPISGPANGALGAGGENGWASGLVISFDTYNGATNSQLNIYWNGSLLTSSAVNPVVNSTTVNFRSANYVPIKISVNTSNQLSVTWNSLDLLTNYALPPAYVAADKSAWNYGFSARTGGLNDAHKVSDVYISSLAFLEYSINNGTSWSTTNPILAPAGTYTVQARPVGITCPNSNIGSVTLTNPNTIDWANLQFPASATICTTGSVTVFGRVYKNGYTSVAGADASMTVQIGYNSSNTNPNTWTNWQAASYNAGFVDPSNDEYQATLSVLAAGTYYYAFRYKYCSDGAWYYGGYNATGGGFWNGTSNISGVLTVNQPSVAPTSISGTTTICNSSSTTLTAFGGSLGTGAVYEWGTGSTVGTNPIAGQSGVSISVSPTATTTYWVRIINSAAPCATTTSGVSTTVTVNQPSVAPTSITGTTTICNGSSTTLTANGTLGTGAVYEWGTGSTVGTNPIAGQSGVSISVSPSATTTYWVRIINGTAPCATTTSGVSTTVTVNQPSVAPTALNASVSTICNGGSTTLTQTGGSLGTGAVWQWYSDANFTTTVGGTLSSSNASLSVSPTSNTTYYLRAINGTAPCAVSVPVSTPSAVSVSVTVNPTSVAGTAGSDQTICAGSVPSDLNLSGNTGTIQWQSSTTSSSAGFSDISSATGSSLTLSSLSTTTYYRAVVTSGVCSSVNSNVVTITVNQPSVNPTSISGNAVCLGASTTLTAVGGSLGIGANYQWGTGSTIGSNPIAGAISSTLSVSPTATTTYWVQIVNGTGPCSATTAGLSTTVTVTTPTIATIPTTGSAVWRGAISTDWTAASNWYAYNNGTYTVASAAPGSSTNVIIPATTAGCVSSQPTVISGTVNANNVTVETGAALTMTTGTLNVAGNFTVNGSGTFTPGTGTVNFTGNGTQLVSIGNQSFNHVTINGFGTVQLTGNTTISGNYTNNSGSLDLNNFNLTMGGNYSNYVANTGFADGLIPGTGSVIFNKTSGTQTVYQEPGLDFNTVQHTGAGTLQLTSDLSTTGDIINSAGTFDANDKIITVRNNFTNTATFTPGSGGLGEIYFEKIGGTQTLTSGGAVFQKFAHTGTGTLNLSGVVEVKGDVVINAPISAGTSTLKLSGTGNQVMSGTESVIALKDMTVAKTAGTVTLSKPVRVDGSLSMTQGNIITSASNKLEIGSSTSSLGLVNWTGGNVVGPMRRWFAGAVNSTPESGMFPVGLSTVNRYAQVNFTQAPGAGGYIEMEYKAGLPANAANWTYVTAPDGQLIQTFENEGYWDITPYDASGNAYPSGLNTNAFTLKLRANGLTSVNDISVTRIIRSPGPDHTTWEPAGFHIAATGTTSDFAIESNTVTGFSWFNIGAPNNSPLPVELLNFNGICDKGMVNLVWQTASEFNSSHFDVEKSTDGETWRVMTTITSAGTSNELLTYQAMDNNGTSGSNYYRLRQVDNDGKEKLYDPINVSCVETTAGYFTSYPNPSGNEFQVVVNNKEILGAFTLNIVDVQGKVIDQRSIEVKDGINMFVISETLNPGIYFLNITNGIKTTQVIKHAVR